MKLLTAWMEVFANLGVLVGIVFLTIEVSQNTLATKSEASMAAQMAISDRLSDSTSNPELFAAIDKVYAEDDLTRKESLMVSFYFHSILTAMDAGLTQYRLGVIEENVLTTFDSELLMLTHLLEYSRKNWENQAYSFSPQMRSYVAALITAYEQGQSRSE